MMMKPLGPSEAALPIPISRVLADGLTLAKPELTFLSMLTAVGGFILASDGWPDAAGLLVLIAGTALVGGGAGALNQYLERDLDARMQRTRKRPLPAGRLVPAAVLSGGVLASMAGVALLWTLANPLTGFLAAATLIIYLLLYTPLKRVTSTATLIGAIPGALPPVMGWTASSGDISPGALSLFVLLFIWQIPHFLALAWTYRRDYADAGFRMLTVEDETGDRTTAQVLVYTCLMLPSSLLVGLMLDLGWVYALAAVVLWAPFLLLASRFRRERTGVISRRLFFGTIIYLPLLLLGLLLARFL
jgi:protoheme IX farnesyltransferase